MNLFSDIELLQIQQNNPSKACIKAVDFLGQLAQKSGAIVWVESDFSTNPNDFYGRGKSTRVADSSPFEWAKERPNRILLIANSTQEIAALQEEESVSALIIATENWQSEGTLFAQSGLAHILGDPEREPLVPVANYATTTIGYAGFTALAALYCKLKQFNQKDIATVNGVAALSYANWKSIAAGNMGKILKREGKQAEWPAIPCKDGYVALIYHVLIWDNVLKMVDSDELRVEKFSTFKGRAENRDEYMSIIRKWASQKTKEEIKNLFFEHGIPGAPIMTINDVLACPLFKHRNGFEKISSNGQAFLSPAVPHRIPKQKPSGSTPKKIKTDKPALPLAGVRVLDLGIITAGAASSAVLADMGAEVLKIESATYADPFRRWAGSTDSPLFKYNNRNKYGVEINLKTPEGKATFSELVKTADVVVENFRRGVLDRIGFSFEILQQLNPNIVLASISGQGLDGPQSTGATFGSTLEANTGFSTLSSYEDGVPYVTGRNGNYPDQTVCLYAGAAIALAVQKSKLENCALHIDISQRDVALFMIGDVIEWVSANKDDDKEAIRVALSTYEVNQFFQTIDEHWVKISANKLSDFNQIEEVGNLTSIAAIQNWIKQKTAKEVETLLHPLGIGAATAFNGKEVFEDTAIQQQEAFLKTPKGVLVKGFPFQLKKTPMTVWGESPEVGEHTELILNGESF